MIGISVISVVSTAVPLLMAVLVPEQRLRNGECALTEVEANTIRSVISNQTCNYTIGLNDILAGLN